MRLESGLNQPVIRTLVLSPHFGCLEAASGFSRSSGRLSTRPALLRGPCSERWQPSRQRRSTPASDDTSSLAFLMLFFGHLDAEKGWTKQLHLGALRSVNTRRVAELGADTGYDNIGDWPQASALSGYLDLLDRENALPRMILYNVNPADNYVFATAAGSFNDGKTPGKIQYGSAWWFLDQRDGIQRQLNTLSNTGLLSRFVGMVTDSRSFMSFPRHEYFRRVLCNLLGQEIERGELPNDIELIGSLVRNVCFENARQFLGLEVPQPDATGFKGRLAQ